MPEADTILAYATLFNKLFKSSTLQTVSNTHITNKVVLNVNCKGKLLWFEFDDNTFLHIHLMLTGEYHFDESVNNIRYDLTFIKKKKSIHLYITDPRNQIKFNLYNHADHDAYISKIGISIFDKEFTHQYFNECIKGKRGFLKSFLLSQTQFSGIGNAIENDAVYLSDIAVDAKCNNVVNVEVLYNNILFVAYSRLFTYLTEMNVVSKLPKRYMHNKPVNIEVPYTIRIYERKGERIHGKLVKMKRVAGRTSFYI